ncbi:GNAT family N-acetyltransferase [[Erwinia] mediterraneensis]|uniref:GNAT family N-acetyltransferase n=1 Tax=[Erwinia] mediterraneensis TaxID=2161819 RepID=UPI0010326528|nr:GNAT family N-acetyltransferase [[Erwinia] mediterraneensis]
MQIRPFTEADRPFLRTLYLAARRTNWTWLDGSDWQLEDFDSIIPGEIILVAEHEGERVGFAGLLPDDNFLHSLYVDPAWQGRGVGSALLEVVQSRFTATGALKCLLKNEAAQRFYKKHGWQAVATGESEQGGWLLMHFPLAAQRASGTPSD